MLSRDLRLYSFYCLLKYTEYFKNNEVSLSFIYMFANNTLTSYQRSNNIEPIKYPIKTVDRYRERLSGGFNKWANAHLPTGLSNGRH